MLCKGTMLTHLTPGFPASQMSGLDDTCLSPHPSACLSHRREQCLKDYQLAHQLLAAAGNTTASEAISSDMRQLMVEV